MDRPHLRPRVALHLPHPPEAVAETIDARLRANPRLDGRVRRQALLVWMAPQHRRWWSPTLDLALEAEAAGTRLVGYYCAHHQLMTGMTFVGILLAFLATLSATWSLVQFQMDESPRCLVGTAGALVGLIAIYLLNRLGQRWAASQMHELASLLQDLGAVEIDEAGAFERPSA